MTTSRESVRAAFKTVLSAAFVSGGTGYLAMGGGVTVYDRLPFEGADQRSVVLTIVSGTSKSSAVGMVETETKRSVMNYYRLQIDCNYDDKTECAILADAVEQAIWNAHDTLRDTYDVRGLQKVLDVDTRPLGASSGMPITREARVILDFTFWTHRQLT